MLVGVSVAVGVGIGSGEPERVGELVIATMLYLPAILAIASLAVALYGLLPRAGIVAWLLVIWVAVVLFLGQLLRLPDWALDISPLAHVPNYPVESVDALPIVILMVVMALFVLLGFGGLRRRDIGA